MRHVKQSDCRRSLTGARVATQDKQAAVQSSVSIRQMPWYNISRLIFIVLFAKDAAEAAPCLLMLLCNLDFCLGQARDVDAEIQRLALSDTVSCSLKSYPSTSRI